MKITKHEAKAICFWLDCCANKKYYDGSYKDIEEIYEKLANYSEHKNKWRWKNKSGDSEDG